MKYAIQMAVGLAAIYSATSVKTTPGDRYTSAVVFVVVLVVALGKGQPLPPRMRRLTVLWAGGIVVYLILGVVVSRGSAEYVTGDALLALLPLLFAVAFAKHPDWMRSHTALVPLLVLLGIAAVTAGTVGVLRTRHEAPSSLLILACWYYALQSRSLRLRVLMLVAAIAVLGLAYSSGYRTHMLLWAIAAVLTVWFLRGARTVVATILVAAIMTVPFMHTKLATEIVSAFSSSRIDLLVSGRPDESAETRIGEFHDVVSTAKDEWLLGQAVVGAGFGSSYQPRTTFIMSNVDSRGRVHSIHMGIALVFFRFGILGLLLYGLLVLKAIQLLRECRRNFRDRLRPDPVVAVGALGFLLFTGEFMTLNASVQPAMSLCAGVVIAAVTTKRYGESDSRKSRAIPTTRTAAAADIPTTAPVASANRAPSDAATTITSPEARRTTNTA